MGGWACKASPQMKDLCIAMHYSGLLFCGFLLCWNTFSSLGLSSCKRSQWGPGKISYTFLSGILSYLGTKDLSCFFVLRVFISVCVSEQKPPVTSLQWGNILVQFLKSFSFLFLPNVAVHCLRATSAYTLWDIDQVLLTTPCFSEVYRIESLPSWIKRNMHENENNWPNNCFSCRAPRISRGRRASLSCKKLQTRINWASTLGFRGALNHPVYLYVIILIGEITGQWNIYLISEQRNKLYYQFQQATEIVGKSTSRGTSILTTKYS